MRFSNIFYTILVYLSNNRKTKASAVLIFAAFADDSKCWCLYQYDNYLLARSCFTLILGYCSFVRDLTVTEKQNSNESAVQFLEFLSKCNVG